MCFLCLFILFIWFKSYYIPNTIFSYYFLKMLAWWLLPYWQFTPWNWKPVCISTYHVSFLWQRRKVPSPIKGKECLYMGCETHSSLSFRGYIHPFFFLLHLQSLMTISHVLKKRYQNPSLVLSFPSYFCLSTHLIWFSQFLLQKLLPALGRNMFLIFPLHIWSLFKRIILGMAE